MVVKKIDFILKTEDSFNYAKAMKMSIEDLELLKHQMKNKRRELEKRQEKITKNWDKLNKELHLIDEELRREYHYQQKIAMALEEKRMTPKQRQRRDKKEKEYRKLSKSLIGLNLPMSISDLPQWRMDKWNYK